jgi:hypothetical protein
VNGTSYLQFYQAGGNGYIVAPGTSLFLGRTNGMVFFGATQAGNCHGLIDNLGMITRATNHIGIASNDNPTSGSAADVRLYRDAANTLAQRNGTNAQAFRVYGTESSSLANFVRASLSSSSTAVTLAAQRGGTAAADIPLNLTAAGTGTIKVNSVAEVVVSSTVAGLPAAPVVGMLTRVTDATAPAVGSTVTGGGAAAALVWYNGANWSVIGV